MGISDAIRGTRRQVFGESSIRTLDCHDDGDVADQKRQLFN